MKSCTFVPNTAAFYSVQQTFTAKKKQKLVQESKKLMQGRRPL